MRVPGGELGFTLIEVMIAIILTAIGAAGMVGLYRVETRSSGYSRHTTEAATLAEDMMEQIRLQIAPTTGQDTPDEPGGVPGNQMFTRKWSVTPSTSWTDYNVTVQWTEDGALRTVTDLSRRSN
ncbi:MAG TPA: prepilin-type N-terminal cleavage/methylation domain-containing protein [Kofleriaceae bacterium]|jgi:type IV pilus modification protein PilV